MAETQIFHSTWHGHICPRAEPKLLSTRRTGESGRRGLSCIFQRAPVSLIGHRRGGQSWGWPLLVE